LRRKKVGIVHNQPASQGHENWEASLDVIAQVESIEKALEALGHSSVRIPFTRDLHGFTQRLKEQVVDIVFNLCETVDEDPHLVWHAAAVFELLGLSFTGSTSTALMLTTDKLISKRLLKGKQIRTPNYMVYNGSREFSTALLKFPVIVKPRFEDASIGIDQDSIFENDQELREGLKQFLDRFGPLLIEEYIPGREFNLTLLGYPTASVFPIGEIDFSAFPEDLYPIVGYRAKWDKASFEYNHSPRRFPRDLAQLLSNKMERVALECFHLFMVRDYGRVDLRVDDQGKVYVLEVNANPGLSADAGVAASARESGLDYGDMIGMIVDFAIQREEGFQA
jgi:D-alanine-D-alanine ligase